MTTRLKFTELEELVRSDPHVDADEAMEYGDWLVLRAGRRDRLRLGWLRRLFGRRGRRRGRKG